MDDEPAENISGGADGGGSFATFDAGEATTRAECVVDRLGDLYWQKSYGGQNAFECLVRTVLSQNTSDVASQPAHDALMERYGTGTVDLAAVLAEVPAVELAETIKAAGLYNQKSKTLGGLAGEICETYGGTTGFDAFVRDENPAAVRATLLEMPGVGPKTADCVLLFAGGREGIFPVDTHVHRITRRMGLAPPDADHETVRERLERDVPAAKCGFGHTAMIQFGREYCTAKRPACLDDPEACPMIDYCAQVGVYPETGEVVDPADAPEVTDD